MKTLEEFDKNIQEKREQLSIELEHAKMLPIVPDHMQVYKNHAIASIEIKSMKEALEIVKLFEVCSTYKVSGGTFTYIDPRALVKDRDWNEAGEHWEFKSPYVYVDVGEGYSSVSIRFFTIIQDKYFSIWVNFGYQHGPWELLPVKHLVRDFRDRVIDVKWYFPNHVNGGNPAKLKCNKSISWASGPGNKSKAATYLWEKQEDFTTAMQKFVKEEKIND